jgi:hypothetical protein
MLKMMFREGVKGVESEERGDGEKRKRGRTIPFYIENPPR